MQLPPISHDYEPASAAEQAALSASDPLVIVAASARIRIDPVYYRLGLAGSEPQIRVREPVAKALARVAAALPAGLGLTLLDGFRSRATSLAIFERIKGEIAAANPDWDGARLEQETRRFCAHPSDPGHYPVPPHLSGGAIDLLLHDLASGEPLDFGTGFDDISERAESDYFERPCAGMSEARRLQIRDNRRLLFWLMRREGFSNYPGEWWHFDLGDCLWARFRGGEYRYPAAE